MSVKIKEENKEKHKWWHELFFGFHWKMTEYRNGLLGSMTPDMDEETYSCKKCKYQKIITTHY